MHTTATSSSGTVTVSGLNILNMPTDSKEFKVQVLDTQSSSLQLALSDDLTMSSGGSLLGTTIAETVEDVRANTNWQDIYNKETKEVGYNGNVTLATTKTTWRIFVSTKEIKKSSKKRKKHRRCLDDRDYKRIEIGAVVIVSVAAAATAYWAIYSAIMIAIGG